MTDDDLDRALRAWRPIGAPAHLRARALVLEPARPARFWPLAIAATLALAAVSFSRRADRVWDLTPAPSALTVEEVHRQLQRDLGADTPLDELTAEALRIDADRAHEEATPILIVEPLETP